MTSKLTDVIANLVFMHSSLTVCAVRKTDCLMCGFVQCDASSVRLNLARVFYLCIYSFHFEVPLT